MKTSIQFKRIGYLKSISIKYTKSSKIHNLIFLVLFGRGPLLVPCHIQILLPT